MEKHKVSIDYIKKVQNYLNDVRETINNNIAINLSLLTYKHKISSRIPVAARKLGYFIKGNPDSLCIPGLKCTINFFDPVHARLVILKSRDQYPKSKKNNFKESFQRDVKTEPIQIRNIIPPTLKDVEDYCNARRNNVNPQKWYNHYESVDWKVGKNKMTDWQAAVRTWEHPQGVLFQKNLSNYSDQDIFNELKKRGYSGLLEINIKKEVSF